MSSVVQYTNGQEENCGNDTVIEHLQYAANHSLGIQGCYTKYHNSHVADRGVSNQLFEIILCHCAEGSVNNADHSKRCHEVDKVNSCIRENREVDSQQPVCTQFQQYSRKDNTDWCGCLNVSIRKPRMEWKQRNLDRKVDEQGHPGHIAPGGIHAG